METMRENLKRGLACVRACAAIIFLGAAVVSRMFAQTSTPSFDQYRVAEAKFSGKPATPVFKTAGARSFRTAIREAETGGPNFAAHYTIAEIGCGGGCVSIAIVDVKTGVVYPGPFRNLSWELRQYEGKLRSDDEKFEQLSYHPDSRLLIARGCPGETNCASYFWEWTGSQFKLVQKIPSVALSQ
jgi:hypothetical protein